MTDDPMSDSAAQSCNATYTRPKTRQRVYKAPAPLDVPHIEQDAAERKRVLNVLAQRRYRERRRKQRKGQDAGRDQTAPFEDEVAHDAATGASSAGMTEPTGTSPAGGAPLHGPCLGDLDIDMGTDWPPLSTAFEPSALAMMAGTPSPSAQLPNFLLAGTGLEAFPADNTGFIDPYYLTNESGSSDASHTQSRSSGSPASLALSAGSDQFADSYYLEVPELTILRAFLRISTRLGFTGNMWSMTAQSPFNVGLGTPSELLPENWRPTSLQVLIPHHPVIDFLPWPSVRDKILSVFTLPPESRPEEARGPMALVNLAYDLEDSAEGVRIWGSDPYDAANWEVGQVLFENWWFIFDRNVVSQSNRLRVSRGAETLKLAAPIATAARKIEDLDQVVQGYVP